MVRWPVKRSSPRYLTEIELWRMNDFPVNFLLLARTHGTQAHHANPARAHEKHAPYHVTPASREDLPSESSIMSIAFQRSSSASCSSNAGWRPARWAGSRAQCYVGAAEAVVLRSTGRWR